MSAQAWKRRRMRKRLVRRWQSLIGYTWRPGECVTGQGGPFDWRSVWDDFVTRGLASVRVNDEVRT